MKKSIAGMMTAIAVLLMAGHAEADLIANWKMDEGSGTTVGDSVNSYDGTFVGSPTWSTNVAPGIGSTRALDFDPAGDWVNLTSHIDNLEMAGSFTLATWVNVDAVPTGSGAAEIMGVYQTASPFETNYLLRISKSGSASSGQVAFLSRDDSSDTVSLLDPTAATLDTWIHYAVTFDAATGLATMYRDGVSVASGTMPNAPAVFNLAQTRASLAGDGGSGQSFNGLLDDAALWNQVLTVDEINNARTMGAANAIAVVPEPSTFALAALGFTSLGLFRRRRTNR